MAEVIAGAGAAGAAGLFGYNRSNFLYDRKMRQETEYQIMDFRIQQAELWREDVRDIIGLTAVKMDTYLILNTVQLGFCVMAFCEGRLATGTPTWLLGCHTLSLAGAFMYLLMSIWLAMHASVTAKSYEVRLLTQYVRLPMPTWSQLEGARTYGSAFEKVNAKQMFRVPFLSGSQETVLERQGVGRPAPAPSAAASGASASAASSAAPASREPERSQVGDGEPTSSDLWGLEAPGDRIYELDGKARVDPNQLRHLRLVREAMQYWQSYDGFARVSMSLGTNQLVTAMSYYVLGYVLISNHALFAALFAVGLFMAIAAALIRLDMSLTSLEYHVSVTLVVGGPFLAAIGCQRWSRAVNKGEGDVDQVQLTMTVVLVLHALWLMFLLYICKVSEQKSGALLPTGFRSVMYIDVFGWIKKSRSQLQQNVEQRSAALCRGASSESLAGLAAPDAPAGAQVPRVPGCGPAVQSVSYDGRRLPVPTRPESLPGASQPAETMEVREEDFVPTTFVPMEKQALGIGQMHVTHNKQRPGLVPWRLFCMATVVLVLLWWMLAITNLMTALGYTGFNVKPILDSDDEGTVAEEKAPAEVGLLQGAEFGSRGTVIPTRWPHKGLHLHGLACGGEDSHEGPRFVAATRFGLFSGHLPRDHLAASADVTPSATVFERVSNCSSIEGEALQDVALQCDTRCRASSKICQRCSALVLHRQGQMLSSCSLSSRVAADASLLQTRGSGPLAAAWLADADDGSSQEEVVSFALCPPGASSAAGCAYAETSTGRIVELRAPSAQVPTTKWHAAAQRVLASSSGSGSSWLPRRIVQTERTLPGFRGGGLNVLGTQGRYLSVLNARSGTIEVLDLQRLEESSRNALAAGGDNRLRPRGSTWSWRLPHGKRWLASCSAGDSLYVVADGASPELWRFPLPSALLASSDGGAATAGQMRASATSSQSRHRAPTVLATD
eukprot:TRINITY_DN13253_c0_g1_i2.p1 TRINITY_DN13253_c0_g1~~TRINITY_DN13253_c0_g1_i2.p1  ORF type:complete len:953 (-),score=162.52 TRINITY_DN13253_c0_g1_i2:190-3048(-)